MNLLLITARQIFLLLSIMIIGWVLCKKKFFGSQGAKELGNILLYVVGPLVIIDAYKEPFDPAKARLLGLCFLLGIAVHVLPMVLAKVFRLNPVQDVCIVMGNIGYLGIPLVSSLFGSEAVFFLAPFIVVCCIIQWTYVVVTLSRNKKEMSVRRMMSNPLFLAVAVALLIYFLQIPIPPLLQSAIDLLKPMNAPGAMMILGVYLAGSDLKTLFIKWENYRVVFIKLVLYPLIWLLFIYSLPAKWQMIKLISLIVAAAPTGINVTLMAGRYNQDTVLSSQLICLSTILCAITIPLLVGLAQGIW